MRNLTKSALLAATAATLVASATPAMARDRYGRGHDGIDAGDVIAGALIIGGIAAIATAASNGSRNDRYDRRYNDRYYDGGYDGNGYYNNGYNSRTAVDQCVRAAQQQANRYGGWARITDVTRIDRIRGGYEVRGRLVVQDRNWGGWRGSRGGWDRGNNYDRYNDGYDKGKFSCVTRYGGVQDVNITGLRYS